MVSSIIGYCTIATFLPSSYRTQMKLSKALCRILPTFPNVPTIASVLKRCRHSVPSSGDIPQRTVWRHLISSFLTTDKWTNHEQALIIYAKTKERLLMSTLENYIAEYLEYCECRKRLDVKSLKAYKIDLKQYHTFSSESQNCLSLNTVDLFITDLHKRYKPKTIKRKIASLKAFFHYLEYKDLLEENPFSKLDVHFREAKLLPKTIPFHSIQKFLSVLYAQKLHADSAYSSVVVSGILLLLNYYLQPEYVFLNYVH